MYVPLLVVNKTGFHSNSGRANHNWLSFPFVLVHRVRQKSSPRKSHSFWVRIKVFIPNTLYPITAPGWGRAGGGLDQSNILALFIANGFAKR